MAMGEWLLGAGSERVPNLSHPNGMSTQQFRGDFRGGRRDCGPFIGSGTLKSAVSGPNRARIGRRGRALSREAGPAQVDHRLGESSPTKGDTNEKNRKVR